MKVCFIKRGKRDRCGMYRRASPRALPPEAGFLQWPTRISRPPLFPFPSTFLLTPGVLLNCWPTLTTLYCNYCSHRPLGGMEYILHLAPFLPLLPPSSPFPRCSLCAAVKMPLNVYNLCVSKSRWVTAGMGGIWQRTHSEFDSAIRTDCQMEKQGEDEWMASNNAASLTGIWLMF